VDASQASYSSDSCLRHVLSKFLLYHFCASSECLLCCPTLFFPRTSIFVLLVLLVAAAAAASPGATSSVTSGLALGVARPACVVVASPRLVAQSSSCRAIFVLPRNLLGSDPPCLCRGHFLDYLRQRHGLYPHWLWLCGRHWRLHRCCLHARRCHCGRLHVCCCRLPQLCHEYRRCCCCLRCHLGVRFRHRCRSLRCRFCRRFV